MNYLKYCAIAFIFFLSLEKSLFCADRRNIPPAIMAQFEKVLPAIAHRSGISTAQLREKNASLWASIAQDVLDEGGPNTELLDQIVFSIFQNICMIACKDLATLQRIATTVSHSSLVCVCIYFDCEIEKDENGIFSLTKDNKTFILPTAVRYVV